MPEEQSQITPKQLLAVFARANIRCEREETSTGGAGTFFHLPDVNVRLMVEGSGAPGDMRAVAAPDVIVVRGQRALLFLVESFRKIARYSEALRDEPTAGFSPPAPPPPPLVLPAPGPGRMPPRSPAAPPPTRSLVREVR